MKEPHLKFFMIVPLLLPLSLILIISFSFYSQPNLDDIVREHIKAVNNEDVKKNLTFYKDDIVFEIHDDEKYEPFSEWAGREHP